MSERISRKEFLKRSAMVALSMAGVTACGRLLSTNVSAAVKPEEIPVGEDKFLLTMNDLETRRAVSFEFKGKKAILLYNDGQVRAFENICTHRGGPTQLEGNKLVCQWHGATFDPLTGEANKSPAPQGSKLPEIKLLVQEGRIFLAE